jgi:hypothetical protein
MAWGYLAVGTGALIGGYLSGQGAKDAAQTAADAQTAAANSSIALQREQFAAMQKMLAPYVAAGNASISSQMDMMGLNGPEAQKRSIDAIQSSPTFGALVGQGENAINANASATGGLRGGNNQGALATFRPQMLNQLISDQFSKLGGLTSVGQNAAAMTGSASQNMVNGVSAGYAGIGSAQAGLGLANGQIAVNNGNTVSNLFGLYGSYLNRPQAQAGTQPAQQPGVLPQTTTM